MQPAGYARVVFYLCGDRFIGLGLSAGPISVSFYVINRISINRANRVWKFMHKI